ncbi:hypothetical protein Bhyg_02627 [Pseudolycoriella hygida]|uniref:THAP-type domain-containing protein n=1 Tax=Pseudolycoriella hygida TaxID=35572 RepID=A0A9Q0S8K0_9DIPT|nr:hypothetical protein Bhyg_02627 [Pseudolycoriella hygida]
MALCIYKNCDSVQKPFSSLAFFTLPKDHRRRTWIENSGNTELADLSATARRVVCEKHFSANFMRKQFHRTILSRDAVPEKYTGALNDSFVEPITIQSDNSNNSSLPDQVECIVTEYEEDAEQDPNDYDENYVSEEEDEVPEIETVECYDDYETKDNNIKNLEQIRREVTAVLDRRPFSSCFQEVEIVTENRGKRKKNDVVVPAKILKKMENTSVDVPGQRIQGDSLSSDIKVSSSSSKTDDRSVESHIINDEDKYFGLTIVGILQRIAPQKKAFAKVNILRYLTELEYGMEAQIN